MWQCDPDIAVSLKSPVLIYITMYMVHFIPVWRIILRIRGGQTAISNGDVTSINDTLTFVHLNQFCWQFYLHTEMICNININSIS